MMTSLWPSATIGQIATLFDSLHKTPAYAVTGYPMIRVTDILRGYTTTSGAVRVDEITFEEFSKKHKPTTGDILFSRVGSYGNSSFVKNAEPFCLGQNTVCISSNRSVIEPFYLYLFLNSPAASQQIEALVGGASQPTISLKSIASIVVPLPPMQTQRRIASILSAYDDLIENNTRRIADLEEVARRLYEEWFVRFHFPGHEQVRMVESELGLIPEGWRVEKVGEVLQRSPAGTTYKKEQIQETGNVIVVDQSTADHLGFHDAAPDHLASVDFPICIFGDHTCKLTLMVRPFSVGPNTIPFVGAKNLDTVYAFQFVQGLVATHEYKRHWTGLCDKKVVLCTKELATAYGAAVRSMVHLVLVLTQKNTNLRAQRDLLLPKLISGELDVSAFPEPETVAA